MHVTFIGLCIVSHYQKFTNWLMDHAVNQLPIGQQEKKKKKKFTVNMSEKNFISRLRVFLVVRNGG